MKYLVLTLICFFTLQTQAQTDSTSDDNLNTWPIPETKARFLEGEDSLLRFIAHHVVYPQMAIDNEISGIVAVAFVVNADGSISDVKIASNRKLGFGLEDAAIAVVKKFPNFKPATRRGEAIRMKMIIPIRFKL